jgi:hypothetical protein
VHCNRTCQLYLKQEGDWSSRRLYRESKSRMLSLRPLSSDTHGRSTREAKQVTYKVNMTSRALCGLRSGKGVKQLLVGAETHLEGVSTRQLSRATGEERRDRENDGRGASTEYERWHAKLPFSYALRPASLPFYVRAASRGTPTVPTWRKRFNNNNVSTSLEARGQATLQLSLEA